MPNLCVLSGAQTSNNAAGGLLQFDFSSSVGAGQQVLAYAVGLSGFSLSYNPTGSAYQAEPMGSASISLVPQLINNVVSVQITSSLNDDDGNAAGDPDADSEPDTAAQVTVLALVDTSTNGLGESILANYYGCASGSSTSSVYASQPNMAYTALAGFYIADSSYGDDQEIYSMQLNAEQTTSNNMMSCSPSAGFNPVNTDSQIDVLMLSGNNTVSGQIVSVNFGQTNESERGGITGSFVATFAPPSGYSLVTSGVGILLQNISLNFSENDTHEFATIDCFCVNGPSVNGNTVTWVYNLNLYNPDVGLWHSYLGSYNVTALAVAQFAANS